MIKIVLFTTGLMFALSAYTQSRPPDDLDIIQSIFGKSKKQMIETYMGLPDDMAAKFWPVYDAYEAKRRELVRSRLYTLYAYVDSYPLMTDDMADDLTKQAIKEEKSIQQLHKKYLCKMKKAVGGLNASKFMQMEGYLLRTVELDVMDDIPFIGDMEVIISK